MRAAPLSTRLLVRRIESLEAEVDRLVDDLEKARRQYDELRGALLSPAYVTNHEGAVEVARRYRERATKIIAVGGVAS